MANQQTSERFKDAGDCPVRSIEIETGDDLGAGADHIGELWVGAEWIDVQKARELRDWLNKVIP